MGNINPVLGLVIEILEQIKKPTSPLKPHYLQFNGVKCKLTAILKAFQRRRAIRVYQYTKYIDGYTQGSSQ